MIIQNNHDLSELLNRLYQDKVICYDSETDGLDWKTNKIVGHVLTFGSDPKDSYYWPVRHASGNWPNEEAEKELIKRLSNPDFTLIMHNASFDLGMLHGLGWKTGPRIEDTMIGAYLDNEQRASLALAACCEEFGVQAKKGKELYQKIAMTTGCDPDRNSMAHYWELPGNDPVVGDYAMGDGTSTWQLWEKLQVAIDKKFEEGSDKSLRKIYKVESKLIPVLHKMQMRGIKVDEERLHDVTIRIRGELHEAQDSIGDVNVRSGLQVRTYMEKNNQNNWPLTVKGNPSFTEEFLMESEAGQKIVMARKRRTLLETFLIPIRDKFLYKGRVHTEFHQCRDEDFGTRTGRMSTSGPNLGAMPSKRQGDLGKLVRSIFVPDEGKQWIESDYKAAEIRIATHYCKAKTWLNGFADDVDPHTMVAEALRILRPKAKTITLGLIMGMGIRGISKELKCSPEAAQEEIRKFYINLPELKIWQDQTSVLFANKGWVSTLLDRKLHLPNGNMNLSYTGCNRLTQGGCADILKERMVAMDELADELGDTELLVSVYDSVSFQTNDANKIELMVGMMKSMFYIPITISMPCDIGTGDNWGEATFNE